MGDKKLDFQRLLKYNTEHRSLNCVQLVVITKFMSRPREAERVDIRSLTLKKAKELFLRQGYRNVTMRAIADAIGFSPAAIYLYYQSKDEILYEINNEGFLVLYRYQKEAIESAPDDTMLRLNRHGHAYLRFARENAEYYALMFVEHGPRDFIENCEKHQLKGMVDHSERSYNLLRENIADCIRAGYFKDIDVETGAFMMWSLVHGIASLMLRGMVGIPQDMQEPFAKNTLDAVMKLMR